MSHALIDEAVKKCSSRYKLAQMIGTHESTLSLIYSGKRKMPPKLAAKIAAVAGLDAQEAAAVAIIESEDDPAEREALKRVFFRAGVAAMLLFSIIGASLAPSPATASTSSHLTATGSSSAAPFIMSTLRRLKTWLQRALRATANSPAGFARSLST